MLLPQLTVSSLHALPDFPQWWLLMLLGSDVARERKINFWLTKPPSCRHGGAEEEGERQEEEACTHSGSASGQCICRHISRVSFQLSLSKGGRGEATCRRSSTA